MAIQDTPVTTGKRKIEDQPVQTKAVGAARKSEETAAFEATQAAFLDNYLTGTGILESYNNHAGAGDTSNRVKKLASDKASMDAEDITEEFVNNPYGDTGSIEETANAVYQARLQALERARNPDVQFAETLVAGEVDTDKIDREGARANMYKILSDMEEDITWGDTAMDFMTDMLPFVSSIKGYNLTGNYFGQDDEIKAAIAVFQNMTAEQQERNFPLIVADLKDKVGEAEAVSIARNFLAPLGAENPQEFGDINRVFDALDASGFAWAIKSALKTMKSSYNVAKSAKELGNEDLAVDSSIAAATNEDYARATGMDSTTATSNLLPFDVSVEDPGYVSGLSGKFAASTKEFFGEVDQTAEEIMTGKGFLKEGILNTSQRADLEAEAKKLLKSEQAENIRIRTKDENETIFEYEIRDENGEVSTETYNLGLTLNDAGSWEQSEMSLIGEYIGSPTAWAKTTLREDVNTAQRVDYLNSKMNRQLNTMTRKALEPIGLIPTPKNRASLAKVDKALREGDEWHNADGTRGTVFDVTDLREKFGLEENEMSAYYRINRLYNNLFNIRNHEKRQEMIALGYKNVDFTRTGESLAGKVFDRSNDAASALSSRKANYVYDADTDEIVNVRGQGEGFYKGLYEQGKRVVRLETPYDVGEGRGKVFFATVSEDAVSDLPQVVLQRKAGYVPRIYENNAYFVKQVTDDLVDGDKTVKQSKTLRFFDNEREANQYVEQLIAREVEEQAGESSAKMVKYREDLRKYEKALERYNAGKRKTVPKTPVKPDLSGTAATVEKQARDKYKVRGDREEEVLRGATGDAGHGSGGLYTGARAQDDILFGLEGTKPQRLNSFESLTRNIGNVSKFTSMNQWRLGLEQRWKNTANEMFKNKGLDQRVEHFQRLSPDAEVQDEVRFLNRMYDQIRDWQNFPTQSERAWNTTVQKLYDAAMNRVEKGGVRGYGYKKAGKLLGSLRGTDPISTARATAFHSLLGWFNISQLWVQAQGAMVAASLGAGKYLTKVVDHTIAFSMLDTGREVLEKNAKNIARAVGTSEEDLLKMHELWKRTGYRDSVLQTADHAAASQGYGMKMDLFRRLSDQGLIFYRAGELTNRRMSFLTAVERWKEKNPGKLIDDIDDDILRSIMDDANNMMLNMGRANRANWQKGVLSLPFQFLQVTTKFLETAGGFNRNFTPGERGRLLFSQLVLYGTAGVPLSGLGTKFAMEALGITQKDIEENPLAVKTWNDGFWGATTFWLLGADMEVASRGSLLRGVSDLMDNWFVQESSIQEKMLGAFGSTATRFWDSFTHNVKPFMLSEYEPDWEDAATLLTSPFLDTVSTWRNIEKAAVMEKLDAIYSRKGRLVDSRDFSLTEEWGTRIGFQSTPAAESWDIVKRTEGNDSSSRKTVDYIIKEMNSFAEQYPTGGYPQDAFAKHKSKVNAAMAVLDPDEQMAARETIYQAIQSGSSRTKAIERAMNSTKEWAADELGFWRSTIMGNKVLRFGFETEEE